MIKDLFQKRQWLAIAPAVVVVLSGNVVAGIISNLFPEGRSLIWNLVIWILIFIAGWSWLYHMRYAWSVTHNLSRHPCTPHQSLILLLSSQSGGLVNEVKFPLTVHPVPSKVQPAETIVLQGNSLIEDIRQLNTIRWNWQQVLRGIECHAPTLKRVRIIGSKGKGESYSQRHLCRDILKHYLPKIEVPDVDEEVDFEDFNQLVRCIERVIREERASNIPDHEIIVDATGGQKTASIAAAAVTLNSEVTFQYVPQNQPDDGNNVFAYDVVYKPLVKPEG